MPISRILLLICAFAMLVVDFEAAPGPRRDWLMIVLGVTALVLATVNLVGMYRSRSK